MITSCFKPVVSGSCQIYLSLLPAIHAAVAADIAPAEPEVTMPDSAPVNSDKRRPTPRCKSNILTKYSDASSCVGRTSGNSGDPLRHVQVPLQLMTVFTPS